MLEASAPLEGPAVSTVALGAKLQEGLCKHTNIQNPAVEALSSLTLDRQEASAWDMHCESENHWVANGHR